MIYTTHILEASDLLKIDPNIASVHCTLHSASKLSNTCVAYLLPYRNKIRSFVILHTGTVG